jgi:pyruvate dehydrogenase E2 component (dihydrolipoamide acetyltransferase)
MTSVSTPQSGHGAELRIAPWPRVDFAAFGEIETVPLSRLQKLSADYLHRNWLSIPHVFHQDEVDITALQAVRAKQDQAFPEARMTTLAYIARAVAMALGHHPKFNASIDMVTGTLVQKRYVHIGIAVDTPGGLLVPVIRDCNLRGVAQIADDIARLAKKAREKGLSLPEMSGGCFTISSLGKSGGTAFTPIINAPEVAILGISRPLERPARAPDGGVQWRLMQPLTLSYDHRVNNGIEASRFMATLRGLLESPQTLTAGWESGYRPGGEVCNRRT